jgi:hypothetical protein
MLWKESMPLEVSDMEVRVDRRRLEKDGEDSGFDSEIVCIDSWTLCESEGNDGSILEEKLLHVN